MSLCLLTAITTSPFLPVSIEIKLKQWLTRDVLEAGLALPGEGRVQLFHFLRNWEGGILDKGATVILKFEQCTHLSQGFRLASNYCGLCGHKAQKKRRPHIHMAALAILSMIDLAGERKAVPIPVNFGGSHWAKIGTFLFAWLGRAKYDVTRSRERECEYLQIRAGDHTLVLWLPAVSCEAARYFFPADAAEAGGFLPDLLAEMKLLGMTDGERLLEMAHNFGKAWARDSSRWIWLAGLRGSMNIEKRQQMIDSFNTDPKPRVFCASLLAGGTGIVLTGLRPLSTMIAGGTPPGRSRPPPGYTVWDRKALSRYSDSSP